ncbi:hypothetical protein [uncultured Robinsoniella sp.]|uniref:hypothetical protein n=1 Tax=uncultured Robinsoniella sp. TaxID=904190 RepID=UPI00374EB3D1
MLKNWLFQRNTVKDEKIKNINIVFDSGVDKYVKDVIYNFCRNIETSYQIIAPLNIYVANKPYVIAEDGDKVVGVFWHPWELDDREECAYIKLAAGDYEELVRARGKINAIFAILYPLSGNIVKYLTWTKHPYNHFSRLNKIIARGFAKIYGERMLDAYMTKMVHNGFLNNE